MQNQQTDSDKTVRTTISIGKITDFDASIPLFTIYKLVRDTQKQTNSLEPAEAYACGLYIEYDLSKSADEIIYAYYLINLIDMINYGYFCKEDEFCDKKIYWDLFSVGICSGQTLTQLMAISATDSSCKYRPYLANKAFLPACIGLSLSYSFIDKYLPEGYQMDPDMGKQDIIGILKSSSALPGDHRNEYFLRMSTEKHSAGIGFYYKLYRPQPQTDELYKQIISAAEYAARKTVLFDL